MFRDNAIIVPSPFALTPPLLPSVRNRRRRKSKPPAAPFF